MLSLKGSHYTPGGTYFCGFIALGKLRYYARFKAVEYSAIRHPCPRAILKIYTTLKNYKVNF